MKSILESVNVFDSAVESKLVKELRRTFPEEHFLNLLEQRLNFYQTNFWYPLDREPESIFEAVIHNLKPLVKPPPSIIGVEWWFSVVFTNVSPQWLLGCHFDRNDLKEKEFEKIFHPKTASVLFLSKVPYGELVVTDQILTKDGIDKKEPANMKFVCPRVNRFVTFPGHLYHGVIGRMWRPQKETKLRIAMAVNWWEHKPINSYIKDSSECSSVFKLKTAISRREHVAEADNNTGRDRPESTPQETAWDLFVASLPDACFMQTSWWAGFMEKLDWGHFGVVVRDGETILGGARVLRNSYSPGHCFYYIPEGPALPEDPEDGAQVYQHIMAYIEKMRQNDKNIVSHLRIEPRWEHLPDYITGFQIARNWMEPRNTLYIDLTPPEAAILAQMKPKGRYNIGLARRHGVTVVEDTSPKGIEDFLRIYYETVARQNIKGKREAYFHALIAMLTELDQGSIFFAEYAGIRIATVLTVYFGRRVTYFYGGSTDQHRQVMAPYLLHFEIMLRAKAQGYEWYDLYGIAPPDQTEHKWANISSFKRKLGGRAFQFVPALDYIYDAEAYADYEKDRQRRTHR